MVVIASTILIARSQPLTALLVTGDVVTVISFLDHHTDLPPYVVTGLLFMIARYSHSASGLTATTAIVVLAAVSRPPDFRTAAVVQSSGIFLAAWTLARLTGSRRAGLLALVAEAEHRAAVERELAAAEWTGPC